MTKIQSNRLLKKSIEIRKDILEMAFYGCGTSHPGPALSCADIVTALYFQVMCLRPDDPSWAERDRFVLSKGHAAPALYAALAEKGYFPRELFGGLRGPGGVLQGHPDCRKTPGVDMTSGSLGNGLALAAGMAAGLRLDKSGAEVFVLLGDGELQEGLVWEAALYGANARLNNLVAIVDYNHFQSCGPTDAISQLEPLADKWESFGWRVWQADGHEMCEIAGALTQAREFTGGPAVILASTVKGKGVSFMEGDNRWHQRRPDAAQFRAAMAELDEQMKSLNS